MSYGLARQAIYALKRLYPLTLDVYYPGAPTLNTKTGAQLISASKTRVRKAILLPVREEREGRYNRSYVRWAVGFTYGGYYDTNTRGVLIDLSDLPSIPDLNCWLVMDHQRFEIKSIKVHEGARAIGIGCVHTQGSRAYEIFDHTADTTIDLAGEETTDVV